MKKTNENEVMLLVRDKENTQAHKILNFEKGVKCKWHPAIPYTLYVGIGTIPGDGLDYDISTDFIYMENHDGSVAFQYVDYEELLKEWKPLTGYKKKLMRLCSL